MTEHHFIAWRCPCVPACRVTEQITGDDRAGRWMDSWTDISAVVVGMAAQGCDLQLTEYAGENWRPTFFVTGMAHSIVKGSAYAPMPWRAVWEVLSEPERRSI